MTIISSMTNSKTVLNIFNGKTPFRKYSCTFNQNHNEQKLYWYPNNIKFKDILKQDRDCRNFTQAIL